MHYAVIVDFKSFLTISTYILRRLNTLNLKGLVVAAKLLKKKSIDGFTSRSNSRELIYGGASPWTVLKAKPNILK